MQSLYQSILDCEMTEHDRFKCMASVLRGVLPLCGPAPCETCGRDSADLRQSLDESAAVTGVSLACAECRRECSCGMTVVADHAGAHEFCERWHLRCVCGAWFPEGKPGIHATCVMGLFPCHCGSWVCSRDADAHAACAATWMRCVCGCVVRRDEEDGHACEWTVPVNLLSGRRLMAVMRTRDTWATFVTRLFIQREDLFGDAEQDALVVTVGSSDSEERHWANSPRACVDAIADRVSGCKAVWLH